MKYITEFRSPEIADALLKKIKQTVRGNWNIMEVCGGQTHSLVKNGILNMLPENIQMIHGPGCPVCVTPVSLIDRAVHLALEHNVILCSYGDMIRVNAIAPGFFITNQNRALLTNEDGTYTERGGNVIRNTPFKRFGNPEELCGALIWLLSDASKFVTGEVICIDCGFHINSGV